MISCACNPRRVNKEFPTIELDIGGYIFKFEPRFYLMAQSNWGYSQKMCDITIMMEPRDPYFMLLGDSFLRAYFTVYKVDERKIGLLSVSEPKKPARSRRRNSSSRVDWRHFGRLTRRLDRLPGHSEKLFWFVTLDKNGSKVAQKWIKI